MPDSIKPKSDNSITLRPTQGPSSGSERDLAFLDWIHDQLTILAEAFGEPLTQERAEIYVGGLIDMPQDRLKVAFRRALYELKFFPKLAELRELSGSSADEEEKVEAQAAWEYANEYLRRWGAVKLPIRSAGKWITPPPLEPRLEYAIRQIGGLWRLNQVTDETYHFMFRDFCEAYMLAPVAELMAPQLLEQFSVRALAGQIKELPSGSAQPEPADAEPDRARPLQPATTAETPDLALSSPPAQQDAANGKVLRMGEQSRSQPERLTRERREELREKLAKELSVRGIPRWAGGLE